MSDRTGWERRWNPLREEWVVYAAHRNNRPWNGAPPAGSSEKTFDPSCHLCPGNRRVSGQTNPGYSGVHVFANDHPVLGEDAPAVKPVDFAFAGYECAPAYGLSRVICYHPDHHMSIAEMTAEEVNEVFRVFRQQTKEMLLHPRIKSVLIFENHGPVVGVSNTHPHCQLYASDFPWRHVAEQADRSGRHHAIHGADLFESIIGNERADGRRMLYEDDHVVAFIPYFARYAYETMIFPKQQGQDLTCFSDAVLVSFSTALRTVLRKMNRNFAMDFPYVLNVMQAPVDGSSWPHYRAHLWLQPPFRQPGLIKYLAGPELGAGNFMADTLPEMKAAELQRINTD